MANTPPTLSFEQLVELLNQVAVLTSRVEDLTSTVKDQKAEIAKLTAMADQGKGGVWMLVAIGGVVGAALSNVKTIAAALIR